MSKINKGKCNLQRRKYENDKIVTEEKSNGFVFHHLFIAIFSNTRHNLKN